MFHHHLGAYVFTCRNHLKQVQVNQPVYWNVKRVLNFTDACDAKVRMMLLHKYGSPGVQVMVILGKGDVNWANRWLQTYLSNEKTWLFRGLLYYPIILPNYMGIIIGH